MFDTNFLKRDTLNSMKKKLPQVFLILIGIVIGILSMLVFYFLYQHNKNTSSVLQENKSSTIESIRNRPFPMAGTGANDAGMETGDDIEPINREPLVR